MLAEKFYLQMEKKKLYMSECFGVYLEMNPDVSGFWIAKDGRTSYWEAGEKPVSNLHGMEGLSNLDSIANSPEAEEAFGKQEVVQGKGSHFGQFNDFFLKQD